jgi:SAM-dependent methyltransferase
VRLPEVIPRPEAEPAFRRYSGLAPAYDRLTAWAKPYRWQAVDELGPRPGETVLDVGCGTGLNFGPVEDRIGSEGLLIGVDVCPAMLARARARADRAGWDNVVLVCASAERAAIPAQPHAVLFCAVHDILRSPSALQAVLGQVPEGGRVVAAGAKWVPWWTPGAPAINWSVWAANRPYVSTLEGFDRPWTHLAGFLSDLRVQQRALGSFYLASGTIRRPTGGSPVRTA